MAEEQHTILFADDNETFLMYVGLLAKRLGYQIYLARDGVEAIKVAKEKKPTVIFLDYHMPKIDGSSCLSIIRKDAELMNTPVIILTASERKEIDSEVEKLGCCRLLRKPVNIPEFHAAILQCLRSTGYKRRNLRAQLNLPVSVETGKMKRNLVATALSHEGMFLRTAAPLDVDTEMNLVFSIDAEDPLELRGKVIYQSKISSDIHAEPGMGIRFLEVPEDMKCRLYYVVLEELAGDLFTEEGVIDKDIRFGESFT